jgi:hypothetical protein
MLTILFFIQYKTVWFENYSKAFAGDRHDQVSNALERVVQAIYATKFVTIVVDQLSDLFVVGLYTK